MPRTADTYRGARRDKARADEVKFPWNVAKIRKYIRPVKRYAKNKRDRSVEAKKRREERSIVMNFLGYAGLCLFWHAEEKGTHARTKAADLKKEREAREKHLADLRAIPFKHYFADDPDKLRKCQERHIHPRHKRAHNVALEKV